MVSTNAYDLANLEDTIFFTDSLKLDCVSLTFL